MPDDSLLVSHRNAVQNAELAVSLLRKARFCSQSGVYEQLALALSSYVAEGLGGQALAHALRAERDRGCAAFLVRDGEDEVLPLFALACAAMVSGLVGGMEAASPAHQTPADVLRQMTVLAIRMAQGREDGLMWEMMADAIQASRVSLGEVTGRQ